MFTARLALRQRWQTKRGPIGNQRIVDWIVFNTDVTIFPNANRDNFGSTFGLADSSMELLRQCDKNEKSRRGGAPEGTPPRRLTY